MTLKKFRVFENNDIILETDSEIDAIHAMKEAHRKDRSKYHEIFRLVGETYIGFRQLKPYDCPECGRVPGLCKCRPI